MGKFNNNTKSKSINTNAKKPNNKPVIKVLPFVPGSADKFGNEYNPDSVYQIMCDLQKAGVFSKMSVTVVMNKAACTGNADAKGVMSVARIQSYDMETGEISIAFYAKNVEFANLVDGKVIVPRVRVGRDSTEVTTILGWEIVDEAVEE